MESVTPGDWKWLNYPDGRKLLVAPSRAVIHCPDARMNVELADQNAIAAVPELIASLEPEREGPDFLDWIANRLVEVHGESPNVDFVLCLHRRADLARKAMRKATGKPS